MAMQGGASTSSSFSLLTAAADTMWRGHTRNRVVPLRSARGSDVNTLGSRYSAYPSLWISASRVGVTNT